MVKVALFPKIQYIIFTYQYIIFDIICQ